MVRLKNKRGQIASTITWFAAFLIIFFVMMLFLAGTAILAGKKNIPILSPLLGIKDAISFKSFNSPNLDSQRVLLRFMNTPVDYSGNKANVRDLILLAVDPYLSTKILGDRNIKDVNDLPKLRVGLESYLDRYGISVVREQFIINAVTDKLASENPCLDFVIHYPLGEIYNGKINSLDSEKGNLYYISHPFDKNPLDSFYGPAVVNIPYKGQDIKVELKFRKNEKNGC